MDISPPLILLHENGYKVLASTDDGVDLRLILAELRGKIERIREGELNVSVNFANRRVARIHGVEMSSAECLATIGELAAGLAHEIRNSLAGVAGVIELVGRDLPVTSPAHAAIQHARLEIAQICRMLTDLLQTARPHPPEIRPSDLNIAVESAVELARQQNLSSPIRIDFYKDPNLPNVEHDSGHIHQVVLNLLLNAVQAIDGAGAIRVEVSLARAMSRSR